MYVQHFTGTHAAERRKATRRPITNNAPTRLFEESERQRQMIVPRNHSIDTDSDVRKYVQSGYREAFDFADFYLKVMLEYSRIVCLHVIKAHATPAISLPVKEVYSSSSLHHIYLHNTHTAATHTHHQQRAPRNRFVTGAYIIQRRVTVYSGESSSYRIRNLRRVISRMRRSRTSEKEEKEKKRRWRRKSAFVASSLYSERAKRAPSLFSPAADVSIFCS